MKQEKELTVKEALGQGYESYFYNSDGWQAMKPISDSAIDWSRGDIYLVEKNPVQAIFLDEDEIKDLLINHFENKHHEETSSDDSYNTIKDAFDKFDFNPFEDAIENVFKGITYYQSSGIKLIK